ncbi:hypothetical protein F5Y18DRAFT_440495 [Xylariaceae sp. FL1019]|nr:hypothetical protein F5Y18DRAFT_440495 [Xylariaceae sp. FL1019]
MAVIKDLPGLKVTIRVDGKNLQEYDDPYIEIADDDDELELLVTATKETDPVSLTVRHIPHVVKYIEATPGKAYEVVLVKEKGFDSHCNHLAMRGERDGRKSGLLHEPPTQRRGGWELTIDRAQYGLIGNRRSRAFMFAELKPVSSEHCNKEDLDQSMTRSKDLGTIRTLWYRMKSCAPMPQKDYHSKYTPDDAIAEKALKGRALYAKAEYGPENPDSKEIPIFEENFQDPQKQPCAVFEFRYRTKEGLIEEGIIPRPTPVDSMTDAEVRAFAQKLYRERENNIKEEPVKREIKRENTGCRSSKRAASDNAMLPPAKRYKETQRGDGKTEIDLSD